MADVSGPGGGGDDPNRELTHDQRKKIEEQARRSVSGRSGLSPADSERMSENSERRVRRRVVQPTIFNPFRDISAADLPAAQFSFNPMIPLPFQMFPPGDPRNNIPQPNVYLRNPLAERDIDQEDTEAPDEPEDQPEEDPKEDPKEDK